MIPSYRAPFHPGVAGRFSRFSLGLVARLLQRRQPFYDYDPFWSRCVDVGVSVAGHSTAMGVGSRQSPTNFMFNHTGHFGFSGEALARGLLYGGVTARFPTLRVALLEGGVTWARGLLGDLISRWEKRNAEAIQYYDPDHRPGAGCLAFGGVRPRPGGPFSQPRDDCDHGG